MSVLKEFKEFAIKGNVVDLAVAVVIGAAFAKIVTSPEVGEIGVHRAAGLEGQLLIRVSQR